MGLKGFQIGAKRFQIGAKRFQIGAETTIRGKRDYKSRQGLQIDVEQMVHTKITVQVRQIRVEIVIRQYRMKAKQKLITVVA